MITRLHFMSAGMAVLALMAAPAIAAAQTLKVGGTGAVTEALIQLGPTFTAATGVVLEVIPSLGTGGAYAAVADGVLGLAVGGRDLEEKELALGLKVVRTLRTPFGLVTSRPRPDEVASADIAGLYLADQARWRDGTPLRIILRPVEESDNLVLGALFPGMTEAIEQARTRSDLTIAATDQDNASAAETTEGSLVGATLLQITAEKRDLRFVAIDGVFPSVAAFEDGTYPFGKTLHVVVPDNVSNEAQALLDFIATPEGDGLLGGAGVLAGAN